MRFIHRLKNRSETTSVFPPVAAGQEPSSTAPGGSRRSANKEAISERFLSVHRNSLIGRVLARWPEMVDARSHVRACGRQRRLTLQRLDQRRVLASLHMLDFEGDEPIDQLAAAIAHAESTAEPDVVQLSAGEFNFAQLQSTTRATLVIGTEITLQGMGPDDSILVGAIGSTMFYVRDGGNLQIHDATLIARSGVESAAVTNEGDLQLDRVAVLGDATPFVAGTSQAGILNRGRLQVSQSAVANFGGAAIIDHGHSEIDATLMVNNGIAVSLQSANASMVDSVLLHNGQGINAVGSDVVLAQSLIHENSSRRGGAGVATWEGSDGRVTNLSIDDSTMIVGNDGPGAFDDVVHRQSLRAASADAVLASYGEMESAREQARSHLHSPGSGSAFTVPLNRRSVQTATVDRQDADVHFDHATNRFTVTVPDLGRWEIAPAETIADLDGGRIYPGTRIVSLTRLRLNQTEPLSPSQYAAWDEFDIATATASAGGLIHLWHTTPDPAFPEQTRTFFSYRPASGFSGTEFIVLNGTDGHGNEARGRVRFDVVASPEIELELDVVERSDRIDVSLTQNGDSDRVLFYDFVLGYDPSIVSPILGEPSEATEDDLSVREATLVSPGRIRVSGFGGNANETNRMLQLPFERIGDGNAAIRVLDDSDSTIGLIDQQLSWSSVNVRSTALIAGDATGDGTISSLDALQIINAINEGEGVDGPMDMRDVDGSGEISALDALWVINLLAVSDPPIPDAQRLIPESFQVVAFEDDSKLDSLLPLEGDVRLF